MKKNILFVLTLFASAFFVNAQIPNPGFEDWDTYPNYLEPIDFISTNAYATSGFYAITRSTDHYPNDVGAYSIRIENNVSLLPNIDALGVILQNTSYELIDGPAPYFPIVGHPESLTGYFKFLPQNGDSMKILLILFNNGIDIAYAELTANDSASDWTSFTIPISNYVHADSGSILIAAYNANGPPPQFQPYGNSVLYIDNLNFDNLILSTKSLADRKPSFSMHPNPASDFIELDIDKSVNMDVTVNIYNIIGRLVKSEKLKKELRQVYTGDLRNGIYMLEVVSDETLGKQKLVIQK